MGCQLPRPGPQTGEGLREGLWGDPGEGPEGRGSGVTQERG